MHPLPDLKGRLRLSAGPRPDTGIREEDFFEVTLHVLGVLSNYRPRVPIAGWLRTGGRSPMFDRVLRVARINPDDPSTFPTNSIGRKYTSLHGKNELYQVLGWGPQYAQGNKTDKHQRLPIVVRGEAFGGPRGSWALTEAGVAIATRVHNEYMLQPGEKDDGIHTPRNATCCWLDGQIRDHGLRDRLVKTLSETQQIRKEIDSGEIDGHVNHWFALAIKRDGLRTRLETYDPPPFRQIKEWCTRAIWTTLRQRAQDADGRAHYGALTERERENGAPTTDAMAASPFIQVLPATEDGMSGGMNEKVAELVDTTAHVRSQHMTDFYLGMERVETAFQTFRPGNASRLSRIFGLMAEGHNVQEMAASEGVSRNRMASLLGAVRGALRDARQASADMYLVLDYLRDNPWSTREDFTSDEEVKGAIADLDGTLTLLEERGRIEARVFKNGQTGYTVAGDALKFLASREDPRTATSRHDTIGSLIL